MSAGNGNGIDGVPKDDFHGHGHDEGKDGAVAKVAGVAIATGIAYSLYKSYFVGKNTMKSVEEVNSEVSNKKVCFEEHESLSECEMDARVKAGQFRDKAEGVKGSATEEKGLDLKSAIPTKWVDVASGKERKVKDVEETQETGSGWFKRGGLEVVKKKMAEDKRSSASDKIEAQSPREKEYISGANVGGFHLEKAGDRVIGKSSYFVDEVIAGRTSKPKDLVWYKVEGSKPTGRRDYSIAKGDTLWSIAIRNGVTIEDLKVANGIWNIDYIVAGDTLTIPK